MNKRISVSDNNFDIRLLFKKYLTYKIYNTIMDTYRIYNIPNIKESYVTLLGKNLNVLIAYIYDNRDIFPDPETRAALSFNMLLISETLVETSLSIKIANDLETLRKDSVYLSKWKNPSMKRQYLRKELETLRKHTEIDDTISLNMCGLTDDGSIRDSEMTVGGTQYDVRTGIETLNVSSVVPNAGNGDGCQLM
jgi:hypothetical protein